MKKKILLFLFLTVLIFTRFYNLEETARFTEDESGFLVRVHQIFFERKITLVGQVNEQGTKVFSSLSVYLLLPFAILGKFDPVSVFYGAAFLSVITALVLLYLVKKVNPKLLIVSAPLILFWFPLVQTGRWAWNPNFIPLWIALGILCSLQKKDIFYLFAGVFFGLSVHQHYYALFAISLFTLLISLRALLKKHYKKILFINLGVVLALIPFIIFDLRHLPGIFLLGASNQAQGFQLFLIPGKLQSIVTEILRYYTQSAMLGVFLGITITFLFLYDLANKKVALVYFLPILFQIAVVASLAYYFPHYFFPIIPFFFVWLIYPRQRFGRVLSFLSMVILIVGGISVVLPLLTTTPVEPGLSAVKEIDGILENRIRYGDLDKVNIAVLGSPDHNTRGRKYRDLLLVPDNINVMTHDEYSASNFLFVITTSDESTVRKDPAYEIHNFRNGPLLYKWEVESNGWVVYLFGKGS